MISHLVTVDMNEEIQIFKRQSARLGTFLNPPFSVSIPAIA